MEENNALTVRNLTPDEISDFGIEPCPINWGVISDNRVLACFQAEPADKDGWLNVHANVQRKSLHPALTYAYAKTFSDQLIDYGALGLTCEIPNKNRAAIRVAAAAGFLITSKNDEFTTLVRHGKQDKGSSGAISTEHDEYLR